MGAIVPTGYIAISQAVRRLETGKFGGLPTPIAVANVKRKWARRSFAYDGWRRSAATELSSAICEGQLALLVLPDVCSGASGSGEYYYETCAWPPAAIEVPTAVAARLMQIGGGLPDHAFRLSPRVVSDHPDRRTLYAALSKGALAVREIDFKVWYAHTAAKGRWPSQRQKKAIRRGRPSKQMDFLRAQITNLVETNSWTAAHGLPALRKLLHSSLLSTVPSEDTLRRHLRAISLESGDDRLRPRRNKSRKKRAAQRTLSTG